MHNPELVRPSVDRVLGLFERGEVAPVIARVFPADEVTSAHEFLAGRRSIGRTIVTFPIQS
jgi:NADPH:quinone reductase-like Zn-dependent oxidoreductase